MREPNPIRGAQNALDALKQIEPAAEVVDPKVVHEGKDLLTETAQGFGNRVLDTQQMTTVLTAMIKDTSFSSATIEEVANTGRNDAYQGMYVIMGDYYSGNAFNVWLARANKQWTVKYSKIPKGGNLR